MEETAAISAAAESQGNYKSVQENLLDVEVELKKERTKGFMRWSRDKAKLKREVGKLVISKVGAVVTMKNKRKKTRLIHDLRRSRVNAMTTVPERVVLPRLMDAGQSLFDIMVSKHQGTAEAMISDYSDAFKHLFIKPNERRFLSGTAKLDGVEGFFYYLALLFGAVAGPLLWGRVAAWLMRCTAATTPEDQAQWQCFVDDPLMALKGTRDEKIRLLSRTLLLWRTLNFQVAWHKIQIGRQVEWIGARIDLVYSSQDEPISVDITITESKVMKMREKTASFKSSGWIERPELKEFAGLMSWAGSVVPALKPYTQMLWGAAYARPAGQETIHWLSGARIKFAIKWIELMLDKHTSNKLCKILLVHKSSTVVTLTFDASLTGGGATWHTDEGGGVTDYITTVWSEDDHKALKATRGLPEHQAEWKAYMLMIAIFSWLPWLRMHTGSVVFRGDAKGVLQGVLANKARSARLNLIIAEISLLLCDTYHILSAQHLWSERNVVCDKLSRLHEGAEMPAEVSQATPWHPVKGPYKIPGSEGALQHEFVDE